MTDVRARGDLGPAFDEKTPTLDRRQLLRAGAWAAPVIVLATAAPAAAQSGDPSDGGLSFKATSLTRDPNINNNKVQYEYHVSVNPLFQNDSAVDTLTFVVTLTDDLLEGPVSGGSISWTQSGTRTWTGTRASNSRGQEAQGKFEVKVQPQTSPSSIAGKLTMSVRATNGSLFTPTIALTA